MQSETAVSLAARHVMARRERYVRNRRCRREKGKRKVQVGRRPRAGATPGHPARYPRAGMRSTRAVRAARVMGAQARYCREVRPCPRGACAGGCLSRVSPSASPRFRVARSARLFTRLQQRAPQAARQACRAATVATRQRRHVRCAARLSRSAHSMPNMMRFVAVVGSGGWSARQVGEMVQARR